tara:strand:+ start:1566 stop:1823 length:258 start_codon:yes stop_codon:yes gene_type:complete
MTKKTESPEQLIQRFTKRSMQLQVRKQEIQSVYDEYIKLERDLTRLEGSMQAIEYVAFGKMPGDGNHDKFKDHKPVRHNDLRSLD